MARNKNVCTANEMGIMALAFACIGQDAGIPDKPYMRIFPTSVDQCFEAIRGTALTCNHPYLDGMRNGTENLTDFINYKSDTPLMREAVVLPTEEPETTEETETTRGRKRDMNGELGRVKISSKIHNFLSTVLPIDVVDNIYGSFTSDRQKFRQMEIEARVFAQHVGSEPAVVNGEEQMSFI